MAALRAQAEEEAARLLARVAAEYEPATAFVGGFGTAVMLVHTARVSSNWPGGKEPPGSDLPRGQVTTSG